MPRKPRFQVPGVPAHVVQRGNNRQPIFFEPSDYSAYLMKEEKGLGLEISVLEVKRENRAQTIVS